MERIGDGPGENQQGDLANTTEPEENGSAPEESSQATRESRTGDLRAALIATVGALVGALIGGATSYVSTQQQTVAQFELQSKQAKEEKDKEVRERRAVIYAKLLDSANKFTLEDHRIRKACRVRKGCPDLAKWKDNWREYQNAYTKVFVYGSDESAKMAWEMSTAMELPAPGKSIADSLKGTGRDASFTTAYLHFQILMCRELPANPRKDCSLGLSSGAITPPESGTH